MFQTFSPRHVLYLAQAVGWTLALSGIAFVGGGIGGALLALARVAGGRGVRAAAGAYVYVVQGTPLLVQLFLAYFGAAFAGLDVPPLVAAAVAFTLYASAFLGEIWRGALQGVAHGQAEAARSLGLRPWQVMRLVVMPQAIRPALPPTVGFLVHLVKNTALASVIGFLELTRAGQIVANVTFQPLPVYLTVAAFYLILCYPLSLGSRHLEARLGARGQHRLLPEGVPE
jgi:polar amino acid transport system permease protein